MQKRQKMYVQFENSCKKRAKMHFQFRNSYKRSKNKKKESTFIWIFKPQNSCKKANKFFVKYSENS